MDKENFKNILEECRAISMWGYYVYEILFSLPIIGFIILVFFTLKRTKK